MREAFLGMGVRQQSLGRGAVGRCRGAVRGVSCSLQSLRGCRGMVWEGVCRYLCGTSGEEGTVRGVLRDPSRGAGIVLEWRP